MASVTSKQQWGLCPPHPDSLDKAQEPSSAFSPSRRVHHRSCPRGKARVTVPSARVLFPPARTRSRGALHRLRNSFLKREPLCFLEGAQMVGTGARKEANGPPPRGRCCRLGNGCDHSVHVSYQNAPVRTRHQSESCILLPAEIHQAAQVQKSFQVRNTLSRSPLKLKLPV